MSAVSIVDVSYVAVPAMAALPPEPIKKHCGSLSPVLQHVLFYEVAGLPPFDSVVRSLRSSLGATLATFAPLAGKLVYLEDTGDVAIACSAADGVKFVAAESDADVRRLTGDELRPGDISEACAGARHEQATDVGAGQWLASPEKDSSS
uniref:Uncharacterized protein n=1 Tax=Oryza rufipogon TaxID=4529 RepID=A0A0E0R9E9_ORYRU